ncbi:hypothetical protein BX616_008071, partial [Lobosporangium transversale]
NAGKDSTRMAFGVVAQENVDEYTTVISGKVDGYASSKAELAGLFAATLISPRNVPTTVYVDSMAVAPGQKQIGKGPTSIPASEEAIWASLEAVYRGAAAIRQAGELYYDDEEDEDDEGERAIRTVQDLYHGLVPKDMVKNWKDTFKTIACIAKYVVCRFTKAIEEIGRIEI